ncbi:MAG: hypothetical protein GX916_04620 [Clostridiales bacterium]|nr:hypothetical protein [Clostridiales bacterium]
MPTKREKYLASLRRKPLDDSLVWAPNFEYWLAYNTHAGTLPAKYVGMRRDDIVRAVGASIWSRARGVRRVLDSSVNERTEMLPNGGRRHIYETPVGMIYEDYLPAESAAATMVLTKHFIVTLDDLRTMLYVTEATHYEADDEPACLARDEAGDDGVVLHAEFCVPFLQFAKTDAGYVNGIYMWIDEPERVEALVDAHARNALSICRLLRKSPADIIACNDNMDELTMTPDLFRRYAIPFYQACREAIAGSGKLFEAHWCGRTPHLLPMVPETGLGVVEAVVTQPMADITLEDALTHLDGKVTLQGGIPSIYMSAEATNREMFVNYIRDTILPLKGRPGFVLGMSDNVPPDADFERVEMVADLIGSAL